MTKIKAKCCKCNAKKGEPLYRYDGKLYCTICMLDELLNNGYISGNDVQYIPESVGDEIQNKELEDK